MSVETVTNLWRDVRQEECLIHSFLRDSASANVYKYRVEFGAVYLGELCISCRNPVDMIRLFQIPVNKSEAGVHMATVVTAPEII